MRFEHVVCCGFLMTTYGYTLKIFLNKPKIAAFRKCPVFFVLLPQKSKLRRPSLRLVVPMEFVR